MALDVLTQIKAAEQTAQETRRNAAAMAKDMIKLAEHENASYKEQMIARAKANSAQMVANGLQASKNKLDALQAQRLKSCDALQQSAAAKLEQAADILIKRILN